MQVFELPVDAIVVGERQRKDFGDLEGLKFSIEQNGLLQPIIVEPRADGRYTLIAGGRRLRAHQELERSTILCVYRTDLDELTRQELEFEENYQRKALNWVEECSATAAIHRLKREKYSQNLPGRFGRGGWSQRDTALQLDISEGKVSQDLGLFEAIQKYPQLKAERSRKDALYALRHIDIRKIDDESIILKRMKDCFVNKSLVDGAKDIDNNTVDLVICDLTHVELELSIKLISDKLNITGHALAFVPLELYNVVYDLITEMYHLQCRKKPYVWHARGDDTYQTYMWFSRGMAAPPRYLTEHTSHRKDSTAFHNLAKPYSLYNHFVDNACPKGGFVFAPVVYDLAIVKACLDLGRSVRAVCPSQTVYEQCLLDLEKKEEQ